MPPSPNDHNNVPEKPGSLEVPPFPPLCPEETPLFLELKNRLGKLSPGVSGSNRAYIREGHVRYLSINTPLTFFPLEILSFKHLVMLDLNAYKLNSLPPEVFALPQLKCLTISAPQVEFPALTHDNDVLEALTLQIRLKAALPSLFYRLRGLRYLDLKINGSLRIGEEIGQLSQLTFLSLYSPEQEGNPGGDVYLPKAFQDLPRLRGLRLGASLRVFLEEGAGLPPSLRYLKMYHLLWGISQSGKARPIKPHQPTPLWRQGCEELRYIECVRSRQIDEHLEGLGHCERLENVRILFSDLTTFPFSAEKFPRLRRLFISSSLPPGFRLPASPLPTLEDLTLILTSPLIGAVDFGSFPRLESLYFSAPRTSTLPESIGRLLRLRRLTFHSKNLMTLPEVLGDLSSLESLDLGHGSLMSLPAALKGLVNLRALDLQHNQFSVVPPVLKDLYHLHSLNLQGNPLKSLPQWLLDAPSLAELWFYPHQAAALDPQSRELLETLRRRGIVKVK
jgi:Leucine-rich repeat (LRR) protein